MVLRTVLLSVTMVTMTGVLVIGVLLFKGRRDKVVKAASPSLLYLILVGSVVLYSETVIGLLPAGNVTCMALPWIRHVGFAMTYGALLIKTWRISVIMKMFTTKMTRTKDAQLFRAVSILILVSIIYMTIWTVTDPLQPTEEVPYHGSPSPRRPVSISMQTQSPEYSSRTESSKVQVDFTDMSETASEVPQLVCILPWWDYVISAAEFMFLIWGGILCYQARKAPDMYNETRPISYAIWNEALWCIFYVYATALVSKHPDLQMTSILCFMRTQCTVTVTLLLLFVPKFMTVFSPLRELRGTVTDVYGAKRVHRLSLMLSRNGAIKTVYCVPCGPLSYAEVAGEEDGGNDSASENGDNTKEEQYTKAEVDTLIEMVSRLKNEKNLYKTQVRRLYHLLKEYRHKIPLNGLPVYLVAETPEQEHLPSCQDMPQPARTPVDGTCNPIFPDFTYTSAYSSTRTLPLCSPDAAKFDFLDIPGAGYNGHIYHNYLQSQSRKASTVTSFLSSTPDNTSINGETSDLISEETAHVNTVDDGAKIVQSQTLTSPVSGYSSGADHFVGALPGSAIVNPSESNNARINKSKADLSLDIVDPCQCAQSSNSDNDDDFPKLIEPRKRKFQVGESPEEIQDFIATICGKFGNKNNPKVREKRNDQETVQQAKSHEMDTLRNGKTSIVTNAMKIPSKALENRRRGSGKSADKMSFVMYI